MPHAAHPQLGTPSAPAPSATGPAGQWNTAPQLAPQLAPTSSTPTARPAAALHHPAAAFNPGAAVPIHKSASHNVLSSGGAAPLVGLPKGFNPGVCSTPPIHKSASQPQALWNPA